MKGKISALVLDFDGHLTNVEEESRSLVRAFKHATLEKIAVRRSISDAELQHLWSELERQIMQRPQDFGWDYNGRTVAPVADHYILASAIAGQLLKPYITDDNERSSLLTSWYNANYSDVPAFQEGAVQLMIGLVETGIPVYIVTNSRTGKVTEKLARMVEIGLPQEHLAEVNVRGNARKYVIDDGWAEMAGYIRMLGLGRDVLLRRKHYYGALAAIAEETNAGIDDFMVMGDIYELDLALPMLLGNSVYPDLPGMYRTSLRLTGSMRLSPTSLPGTMKILSAFSQAERQGFQGQ